MSLVCLDNVIGLSPTNCNCFDAAKPGDFAAQNVSSSGLYVMQPNTITVRWTNSSADCENEGVWQLAIQARKDAVKSLTKDFFKDVQKSREEQFLPFTKIGDSLFNSGEAVKNTVAAVWVEPYRIRGAKITVTSVDLAFFSGIAGSTDVVIEVYSNLDFTTPLGSATATVTVNKQFFTATFGTPITIDLGNIREDKNERIYFVYTIPSGAAPVKNDTEIYACCRGSGEDQRFRDNPYLQILTLGGIQASSVVNLETPPLTGTSTMQGMVINANLVCDYWTWLCNLSQNLDIITTTGDGKRIVLGGALSDALQAKSIINLIDSILLSSKINIFTMVLGDMQIKAIKARMWPIYWSGIKNLSFHMPGDISDCLVCVKSKLITKSPIFT